VSEPARPMPSEEPYVMRVRGLGFSYARERILEDVDLDIKPCDFLALIGPNGGGKTTLVKLLLGLLKPDTGQIESTLSARGGSLGYVPQFATFDRNFPLRVDEVVRMGTLGRRGVFRRYTADDQRDAAQALERLDLSDLARAPIAELSGGQVQRVLIARALASDPEILFLDEPTASIDPDSQEGLRDILLELNTRIPIVIVTHDLGSLPRTVKNVACLNRALFYHPGGEISEETLEQVYGCAVDLIAHGHPHRVLDEHGGPGGHGEPPRG
jgi:zinc transport system ATP-binding protein